MLETAGALILASGAEIANEDIDGKLGVKRSPVLGALDTAEPDDVSDARLVDGTGGMNCGKDVDVTLTLVAVLLELAKLGGISGNFGPVKFEAPVNKVGLNPEYCIGCCSEGGTESPWGGRSNVCWGI